MIATATVTAILDDLALLETEAQDATVRQQEYLDQRYRQALDDLLEEVHCE